MLIKKVRTTSMFKSALAVTIMLLIFKVVGFIKQTIIAYYFGATIETDIYNLSSGFITLITEALIQSLSVALIAIYTQVRTNAGKREAQNLVSSMFGIVLLLSIGGALILGFGSPILAKMLAPTYGSAQIERLSYYISIMAGMIVFIGFELIAASVLNAEKSYFIPRFQSLIYSVCVILACVFLSKIFGVQALVIAFYTSSLIYSVCVFMAMRKYVKLKLVNPFKNRHIKMLLLLALPVIIGNSAMQINQLVDRSIASGLRPGDISAMAYAQVLVQFVTAILISSIGSIMFSHFSNLVAEKKSGEVNKTLTQTLNILICLLVPISIITFLNSGNVVEIVYYRGSFDYNALVITTTILMGYAPSFVFIGLRDILTQSMYSHQDTKRPVINSVICIAINIAISIILSRYIGVLGIVIGTSVAYFIGCILNIFAYKRLDRSFSFRPMLICFAKSIPAAIAAIAALLVVKNLTVGWNSLAIFAISVIVGAAVYFGLMIAFKTPELIAIFEKLKPKKKAKN